MPNEPSADVTRLLLELKAGNRLVLSELMPAVYAELRRLAASFVRGEGRHHTMLTTDLVHEAYLKLVGTGGRTYENRAHFFSVAATAMRQILIDEARRRNAVKRGGGLKRVELDEGAELREDNAEELIALDEALTTLAVFDPALARVVELRFFTGLTIDEVAGVLDVSASTVKREWVAAKAWLSREMGKP